jgi:hypothetical protein
MDSFPEDISGPKYMVSPGDLKPVAPAANNPVLLYSERPVASRAETKLGSHPNVLVGRGDGSFYVICPLSPPGVY